MFVCFESWIEENTENRNGMFLPQRVVQNFQWWEDIWEVSIPGLGISSLLLIQAGILWCELFNGDVMKSM